GHVLAPRPTARSLDEVAVLVEPIVTGVQFDTVDGDGGDRVDVSAQVDDGVRAASANVGETAACATVDPFSVDFERHLHACTVGVAAGPEGAFAQAELFAGQ